MKKLAVMTVAVITFISSSFTVGAVNLKDLFNAKYYAEQYPDLKAALGDDEQALYQHFMKYGIKEGRVMNPIIDVVKYREEYADLEQAFGDNWDAYIQHYFTFGVSEKRDNGTDFDLLAYMEAYGDVKDAFGNDYAAIAEHYVEHGMTEGRNEGSKAVIAEKMQEAEALMLVGDTEDKENNITSGDKTEQIPDKEPGEEDSDYQVIYDEEGNVKEERWFYSNHSLAKYIRYNSEGIPCVSQYFYESGKVARNISYYDNGLVDYDWKYYESGEISEQYWYRSDGTKKVEVKCDELGNTVKYADYNEDESYSLVVEAEYNGAVPIYEKTFRYGMDGILDGSEQREYDANGNEVKMSAYYGDGSVMAIVERGYSGTTLMWEREKAYDADGNSTTNSKKDYNEAGNVIKRTYYNEDDSIKTIIKYEYNENGNAIKEIWYLADGSVNYYLVYGYNESGEIVKTTQYDADGNVMTEY